MRAKRSSVLLGGFAAAAVVIAMASASFACQVLATLSLSPKSGPAGTEVTATGANYSITAFSEVVIRLDSRDGPVLARTVPLPSGHIVATFRIPADTSVGYHTILATQLKADGTAVAGTPGRASFEVTGAGSSSPASQSVLGMINYSPMGFAGIALVLIAERRKRRSPASSSGE